VGIDQRLRERSLCDGESLRRQFHDFDLVSTIESALASNGLQRDRLVLEITESVTLLNVTETVSIMEQLSSFGIHFALDDFGTGSRHSPIWLFCIRRSSRWISRS